MVRYFVVLYSVESDYNLTAPQNRTDLSRSTWTRMYMVLEEYQQLWSAGCFVLPYTNGTKTLFISVLPAFQCSGSVHDRRSQSSPY